MKSRAIADHFELDFQQASKVRCPETGALTGFKLECASEALTGRTVYIFDDICDGGGTFLGLGTLVKECNPSAMVLRVTNGIFSNKKNHEALKEMYSLSAKYDWRA